jgi:geranylgeranyl transferase type-2 subunit beta
MGFRRTTGGFAGRRGGADLYYTEFALRVLHVLGSVDEDAASGAVAFARSVEPRNVIDVLDLLSISFLTGRSTGDTDARLGLAERFRSPDGGYSKSEGGRRGSTYHSFLAALAYDIAARKPPDSAALGEFVLGRRMPGGGFAEGGSARAVGTNSTAAGVALCLVLGLLDQGIVSGARELLSRARDGSGGFRASERAPVPDLMSTYTACVALAGAGVLEPRDVAGAVAFARACEAPDGGFSAGPWDGEVDVEYTYYGLGVLALQQAGSP